MGYLGHTLALTSLELQLPHRSEGDWHTNFLTLSSLLKRKKVKMCCVRPDELIVLIAKKQQGPFESLFTLLVIKSLSLAGGICPIPGFSVFANHN